MPGSFEVLHSGSWWPVECVRIAHGRFFLQLESDELCVKRKEILLSLRLRSRKARSSDCSQFLKAGNDVCIFWVHPKPTCSAQEISAPAWHDAKIISIMRKRHSSHCKCRFFVSFYTNHVPFRRRRELDVGVVEVPIANMAILQRLRKTQLSDGSCQLFSVEDCQFLNKSRLFSTAFLSETAWLLVISILKEVNIEVKIIRQNLVYRVTDGSHAYNILYMEKRNGFLKPKLKRPALRGLQLVVSAEAIDIDTPEHEISEHVPPGQFYEFIDLRRSKRQRRSPDFLMTYGRNYTGVRYPSDVKQLNKMEKSCSSEFYSDTLRYRDKKVLNVELPLGDNPRLARCSKPEVVFCLPAVTAGQNEYWKNHTRIIKFPMTTRKNNTRIDKRNKMQKGTISRTPKIKEVPMTNSNSNIDIDNRNKMLKDTSGRTHQMRKVHMTTSKSNIHTVTGNKMQKGATRKTPKSCISLRSKKYLAHASSTEQVPTAPEVTEVADTCINNTKDEKEKWERNIKCETSPINSHLKWKCDWGMQREEDAGKSDVEELWKVMAAALFEFYSLQKIQAENLHITSSNTDNSNICLHEYAFQEKIGLVCKLCHRVGIEIQRMMPPFMMRKSFMRSKEESDAANTVFSESYNSGSHVFTRGSKTLSEISKMAGYNNTWELVPEFKAKLHSHQKKAFEFLWRNISGSIKPSEMDHHSHSLGGCILSHSPGSGKTLTVISFLISYLKIFPGKRPLIIAPKITLYVWRGEFEKWGLEFPVHQIFSQRSFRIGFKRSRESKFYETRSHGIGIMHILDCLDKMHKWYERPSVLLMNYSSFFSLMRNGRSGAYAREVKELLREGPGILILDEGHNARSNASKLRRALMEVKTGLRILLSGTLFQNNFEEYFNTLCLARPSFIDELSENRTPAIPEDVDSITDREKHARKFFVERIANRIISSDEQERKLGLHMLNCVTDGFIDIYTNDNVHELPGLQSYTIFIRLTSIQKKIMSKLCPLQWKSKVNLEVELLTAIGSEHPWLVTTSPCAERYFTSEELQGLEKYKLDHSRGPKMKFVIDLVGKCTLREEKILIFCHNIKPINLLVDLFHIVFGWSKSLEVLVLCGLQDMLERAQVMDRFKEAGGPARVLIASTTACAEGISLVAASRVVLLDIEWNPSKVKQAIARAYRPGQKRVVYVYRLLAYGTMEEVKYRATSLKERQSRMLFTGRSAEDSGCKRTADIDDDILRELVEDDKAKMFEMILKDEKRN